MVGRATCENGGVACESPGLRVCAALMKQTEYIMFSEA